MTILVTGAAGFIGFHVATALLARGETVIGVDNLNDYYTPALKEARLEQLRLNEGFEFHKIDIADHEKLKTATAKSSITDIVHLAAQAGVRYSLENPFAYAASNLTGHLSILELARVIEPNHMVYASSSSVYGANEKTPFAEADRTDTPVSLYGATKKADENLSVSYAQLYQLPLTGLRFFTVYGPWGRPDMAYWIFTEKILKGETINIFNKGDMARDFTYVDDIVDGVLAALAKPPGKAEHHHRIFNLGNDHPEKLMDLVTLLETELGIAAKKSMLGMQKGDVKRTWADVSNARKVLGYEPKVQLAKGISRYIKWRREIGHGFGT